MLVCALTSCASAPAAINPVSWWHSLEGGPIAQQRPAPPGATAPYPNLANVPKAPTFLPAPERARISSALLADRTRTAQQVVLEPIPPAQEPATTPASPPATAEAAPGAQSGASATLPAATSQPPPQAPAATAPPLPATIAAATAALPSVPLAPPPPPALAGIPLPGPPPQPFLRTANADLTIHFAPGSIALGKSDRQRLAALAQRRDDKAVAVIGFGDAKESDPVAQAAGLRLGLARAEAVAATLTAHGVPASALRLEGQASGTGTLVELIGALPAEKAATRIGTKG